MKLSSWLAIAVGLLSGCSEKPEPGGPIDLLSTAWSPHWQQAEVPGSGTVAARDHTLSLPEGKPMTVAKFTAWKAAKLPLVNYAITMEARRVAGSDFFAALTFPIGSAGRCLTFINGGWGGSVTGLSNIDSMTASENSIWVGVMSVGGG